MDMFIFPQLYTDESLPGWTFRAWETSPEVWKIEAVHEDGRSVARQDIGFAAVLEACKKDARSLTAKPLPK
jgi:hypothetical protein